MSPEGSPSGSGQPDDPTSSFALAREICAQQGCRVRLAGGVYDYEGAAIAGPCVHIEGGLVEGDWLRGETPTVIMQPFVDNGSVAAASAGGKVFVERLDVRGGYAAAFLDGSDLTVVRDSVFSTEYNGVAIANEAHGVRVCNTDMVAGYSGVDISWSSYDIVLEDVTIGAGYEGVGLGWESHDVFLKNVTIDSAYDGVGLGWSSTGVTMRNTVVRAGFAALDVGGGSSDVVARDSELQGGLGAVVLSGGSNVHVLDGRLIGGTNGVLIFDLFGASDVHVIGNRVRGVLPPSDPEKQIEIRDNIQE